ncbi:hypothetical protein ACU684_09420 [Pseudomonas sp. LF135]
MSEIKERPILFSAPMVRAILEGRKTVTRREVKGAGLKWLEDFTPEYVADPSNSLCPYGKPGDRLWLRETWYCDHFEVMRGPYLKPDDMDIGEALDDGTLVYAADGLAPYEQEQPTWKPSIHMPRWASRILLEITAVRVERLQDISEDQAKAEGVRLYTDHAELGEWWHVDGIDTYSADPRKSFELLWSSVGGDWQANPWVWVVEFKRVTP